MSAMLNYSVWLITILVACMMAHDIRLYAIRTYGTVIHEFDPWFNYRATEYLAEHGWHKFFHWFDYESWYPLGRPVGTTIYPGMQVTAVGIWQVLAKVAPMSLNDVCCYIPAWFGVSATVFLGLLARECSGSLSVSAFAALIMSIVPAHIMRSVGGGYDNESIAMTAMCATFFFWCRSLRSTEDNKPTASTYFYGALCGLAYIYMVAAWGGFVFVLNMIGLHAAALVVFGRFSSKLYVAYSLFYVIGTIGAVRVPPVGWGPLKSMEQLAPLLVFIGFQVLEYVNMQRRKHKLSVAQTVATLVKVAIPLAILLFFVCTYLYSIGYFGPLTARVRGLFVKHTRTGNPFVDSVAEHQPGSARAYQTYLHNVYVLAPIGFLLACARWTDANSFLVLYALVAYYFSSKMARLVILLGPVSAALGGVALGTAFQYLLVEPMADYVFGIQEVEVVKKDKKTKDKDKKKDKEADSTKGQGQAPSARRSGPGRKKRKDSASLTEILESLQAGMQGVSESLTSARAGLVELLYSDGLVGGRLMVGLLGALIFLQSAKQFYEFSHHFADQTSQPQIMFKAQLSNGQQVIVDDYREAYHWLRDKSPQDARVMAWWDYGYQIAGIAKRTSIADGNTWNHEHIATLGRMLTAPEEEAHGLIKHLADYVLVWAGGGGDDLAKSPHLARIGNSVYPGHCSDPTCSQFGFLQDRTPTPMMAQSLLYKLCQGVGVNETYFKHAYSSKYGKVKIYRVQQVSKRSKDWIADPKNRVCDAEGSWYCTGQYPPALQSFIATRRDFKQLEDFNVKKDAHSQKYHEEYMRRMGGAPPSRPSAARGAGKAEL